MKKGDVICSTSEAHKKLICEKVRNCNFFILTRTCKAGKNLGYRIYTEASEHFPHYATSLVRINALNNHNIGAFFKKLREILLLIN